MVIVNKLKLDHLFHLTDCTGIIQHCKYSVPDLATGYTTDDNARALIVAAMLYNKNNDKKILSLIIRYLSFLHFGQNNRGRWKNFMNYQREFIEAEGSEDSFGRSLWSLGYLQTLENLPIGIIDLNKHLIKQALPNIEKLSAYRAQAYSIIGLSYLCTSYDKALCKKSIENTTNKLLNIYKKNKSDGWLWFEDIVTYSNGILPYALMKAYQIVPKESYLKASLEILCFLDYLLMQKGYLNLIGCNGWAEKGKPIAQFDQQPIDAADMVLAYSEAYKITGDIQYLQKAEISYKWFTGLNYHSASLINADTGGCFDGLTKSGVNLNQGAESLFAYMISYLTAENMGIIGSDIQEEDTNKLDTFEEAV